MRTTTAGVLAAAVALVATELVHAVAHRVPSLVVAVAQAVARAVPGKVAVTGVETVGRADKPALVVGAVVVSLVCGGLLGRLGARRPLPADAGIAAFGLVGVLATASLGDRPVAWASLAAVVGAACGIATRRVLTAAALAADDRTPARPGDVAARRRFLVLGGGAAGASLVGLGTARSLERRPRPRVQVTLPPAGPGGTVGTGTDAFAREGITPLITRRQSFYRIDEALLTPEVDLDTWRLRVTGLVDTPLELTFDEILAGPLHEATVTLSCVSNDVGGPLVGTAVWRGVRLDSLLRRAGVSPEAEQVVGRSVDKFTVGFPLDVALDGRDALVAVGMNGGPLPAAHGFPARLVVPGLYGYVSATKWLTEIQLTRWNDFDAYWVERGWAKTAPVKVQSRIDVPRDGSEVRAGPVPVGGVAWAPHRGIARVEVRVDGGPWREATLGPSAGRDAWRQWRLDGWTPTAGEAHLEVRATTSDGEVQTAKGADPFPDGATGHHRVTVRVR